MPVKLNCYPSPSWRRTVSRFAESEMKARTTIAATANAGATAMVNAARANLKRYVYTAAWPDAKKNKYTDVIEYMAKPPAGRRTLHVWRACKIIPAKQSTDEATAVALVDPADFEGYFYALILDKGGEAIDYTARPFWSDAQKMMAGIYQEIGEVAIGSLKKQIEGTASEAELGIWESGDLETSTSASAI